MCDCYSVINPSSTVCVSITDPGMTLKHRDLTVRGRVATVAQPLTHLNGLRVLQHLREVGVDDLLEELVLGGAWRRHDDLDLSEKQLETKTKDICVIQESKPSGDYIMNFYRPKYVSCKKTESGERTRCPRGRGRAQGGRACPPPSWRPRVLPGLLLIFLFF